MKLLVGCPIRDRLWILPQWFQHVEIACRAADVIPEYVFVVAGDDPDREYIKDWVLDNHREAYLVDSAELAKPYQRGWSHHRYREMVLLRNWLLFAVRKLNPDLFLSLDSDVLLHQDAVVNLLETVQKYDAVGGRCYMSANKEAASYIQLVNSAGAIRTDSSEVMAVDVIMAIKMMTSPAYHIDYAFDILGEDIGFCRKMKKAGLTIGWDGRVVNRHIMRQEDLDKFDSRAGW